MQQVGAEAAFGDQRFQRLVGRRDHAHVDFDQLAPADAEELAFGEHAQQPRLQRRRHVADLVQEQRAAMGLLEAADMAPVRAGEGAGLVAEQFAFQQLRRDCRGVQRHERLVRARRFAVQRARDQFLAGAGLAGDQHVERRLRHAADAAEQGLHRRGFADQQRIGRIRPRRGLAAARDSPIAFVRIGVRKLRQRRRQGARGQRHRGVQVERLGQEFVGAAAEGAGGAGDVGVGAHHDHRQVGVGGLEFLQQCQAVVAGHAHVGEDQVGQAQAGRPR